MATQRIISSDFLSKTLNGTQFLLSEVRIRTAFEITIYYRINQICNYINILRNQALQHERPKCKNQKQNQKLNKNY
jgi:hypothetical protein